MMLRRWLGRFAKGLGWLLLLALLVAALTAWLYARRATPKHDGVLSLPGVRAEVRVERDAHGIPTIKAATLRDAVYALGVVHAQDRLWQLETHRRIGSGRMAEAVGEGGVETDRFLRVLGIKRAAQAQWARLQQSVVANETRDILEAYAAGINDTVTLHTPARPPEMMMLGVNKEPWTPVDSMAWATVMAWDLGANWNHELLRLRLALKLPTDRVHDLVPPYPGDKPLSRVDLAALYAPLKLGSKTAAVDLDAMLARTAAAAWPSGVDGTGSNNWVLAGTHTTTGKPLLANDPHLRLTTPALWYFVRIEVPGLKLAGASMPGLPTIVLGQNQHLAWGFTNTAADVQDLYIERVDANEPLRYETPSGPATMTSVNEIIKVKGKPDVAVVARATRHGPVISDAGTMNDVVPATSPGGANRHVLALRWTALDPDVDTITPAIALMRATSVAALVEASKGLVAPMQNIAVADTAGRIGFVAAGRVPKRGADNDLKGYAPALGWQAKYDWEGFVDADATPREFDPARGWIATANQRIHGPDYPHHITADWTPPYRQQRIEALLLAKPRHSLADLREMQADVKSLAVDDLLPKLQAAQSSHPLAAAAHVQLKAFDGVMAPGSAAAAVYWVWLRQLTQGVIADEMGADFFDRTLATRNFRDAVGLILGRNDPWWCDDKATPTQETCPQQVDAAFTRALDELQGLQGADVAQWRWGNLHVQRAEHRPFSRVKLLARWFESRVPVGGDTFTINAARVNQRADATTGERYLNEHGPSLRALYDVADPSKSRFMHASGQSGLPWSSHYRDMLVPWSRVEDLPLWPEAGQAPKAVLILSPP
jgi:penicillin G amidase